MTEAERICRLVAAHLPRVKVGSLRFWGSWFGKPYDNSHRIERADVDADRLVLTFSDDEVLMIWTPEGATVDAETFAIRHAVRVRWEWYFYGRPKLSANRYFQDFRRANAISVETNVDWYDATLETDPTLPAVEIL